jgi:hypothetical protein
MMELRRFESPVNRLLQKGRFLNGAVNSAAEVGGFELGVGAEFF